VHLLLDDASLPLLGAMLFLATCFLHDIVFFLVTRYLLMMHFFLMTNTTNPPLLGDEVASSHVTRFLVMNIQENQCFFLLLPSDKFPKKPMLHGDEFPRKPKTHTS
jgi:hypothetical protein